ncbi:MAG: hypothetical protein OEY63_02345 [Gemmatimonadota bacterium]|nr:hypothetical protein [Gemmatimonadota bacterium]MDH5803611.1 hypothetical protein [Gemmatimonadota bacterium]
MPLIVVAGIVTVIGLIIAAVIWADKKRTEAISALADRLNFSFQKDPPLALETDLSHFHLFSQGHSRKIKNVLIGLAGDIGVYVFDYKYTTGGGKSSHTWNQTVMLFRSEGMQLPEFALRPENFFHRIGQVFGFQDIDFDSHPVFSKNFLLRGEDEVRVRTIFNESVLSYYDNRLKISTEGRGTDLIYYQHAKRKSPDQLEEFIRDGVQVLTLFKT